MRQKKYNKTNKKENDYKHCMTNSYKQSLNFLHLTFQVMGIVPKLRELKYCMLESHMSFGSIFSKYYLGPAL